MAYFDDVFTTFTDMSYAFCGFFDIALVLAGLFGSSSRGQSSLNNVRFLLSQESRKRAVDRVGWDEVYALCTGLMSRDWKNLVHPRFISWIFLVTIDSWRPFCLSLHRNSVMDLKKMLLQLQLQLPFSLSLSLIAALMLSLRFLFLVLSGRRPEKASLT